MFRPLCRTDAVKIQCVKLTSRGESNFTAFLLVNPPEANAYYSSPLITGYVTVRRPIASRFGCPVAWWGGLPHASHPMGHVLLKTWIICRSPLPRKLSSRVVARRAGNNVCTSLGFSPARPGRPSGSPGGGVFPLSCQRLEMEYLQLPLHVAFARHASM